MSSITDDRPPLIWKINLLGAVLVISGMVGCVASATKHDWLQLTVWGVWVIGGWFLVAIQVPHAYPAKLFSFDLYALLQPILLTIFIVLPMSTQFGLGPVSIKALLPWVVGLWAVYLGAEILIKVAGRVGIWLVGRKTVQ